MNVFAASDMKVAAVSMPSGVPAIVAMDGIPSTVVVSGFGADLTVNAQFMRSLGSVIYVYPFGDNVGRVRVNFTTFMNSCGGQEKGLGSLLGYYNTRKLSKSSSVVGVTIAGASFSGYLVGFSAQGDQANGVIPCYLDLAVTGTDSTGASADASAGAAQAGARVTLATRTVVPTLTRRVFP